jgi:hypothetical protein
MTISKRPNNVRMTAPRPNSKKRSPTKQTVAAKDAGKRNHTIRKALKEL